MKEARSCTLEVFLAWKRDLFEEEGNFKANDFSGGQCMRLRNSFPHFAQLSVNYELVYEMDAKPFSAVDLASEYSVLMSLSKRLH